MEYRFLNYLFLKEYEGRRRVFLRVRKTDASKIRRDVLSDLSRLLDARYFIAERVYFHHAKIAAGVMIGRALQEMILDREINETDIYTLSDEALIDKFSTSKNEISKTLGNQLRSRSLFKRCGEITMTAFNEAGRRFNHDFYTKAKNRLEKGAERTTIENETSEKLGVDSGKILLYFPQRGMNMKLARTLIVWGGKNINFKDIEDAVVKPRLDNILEAHKNLWTLQVFASPELSEKTRNDAFALCEEMFLKKD